MVTIEVGTHDSMAKNRYSMSFTAGALLYQESLTLAHRHDTLGDWDLVRAAVVEGSLLKMRTLSASKRIYKEVAGRLRRLGEPGLDLFLTGTRQEQNHMLWLGVCKRYRFIHEFAVDVNTWGVAALGPQTVDTWYGAGTA